MSPKQYLLCFYEFRANRGSMHHVYMGWWDLWPTFWCWNIHALTCTQSTHMNAHTPIYIYTEVKHTCACMHLQSVHTYTPPTHSLQKVQATPERRPQIPLCTDPLFALEHRKHALGGIHIKIFAVRSGGIDLLSWLSGRLRQEDGKFKASLNNSVRANLEIKSKEGARDVTQRQSPGLVSPWGPEENNHSFTLQERKESGVWVTPEGCGGNPEGKGALGFFSE